MRSANFISWTVNLLLWQISSACTSFQLQSTALGNRLFTALPDASSREKGLDTGRASYVTNDSGGKIFLYHVILEGGVGRWVISDVLGDSQLAVAYVDSWAIMPTLIQSLGTCTRNKTYRKVTLNNVSMIISGFYMTYPFILVVYISLDGGRKHTPWQLYDGANWGSEPAAFLHCINSDAESAFYLDVKGSPWFFSGFFVETGDSFSSSSSSSSNTLVYSMVANSVRRYLYKVGSTWILSGEIGSTTGDAYVEDAAAQSPADITNPEWHFGNGSSWALFRVAVIAGNRDATVLRNLHLHRRISALPPNQQFFELANGLAMPSIGRC
jgi:hypothetical protein